MPYGLVFRWFHFGSTLGDDLGNDIKSLACYLVGQCCRPPARAPPTMGVDTGTNTPEEQAAAAKGGSGVPLGTTVYPSVAQCSHPPEELLEVFAAEVLEEDERLRRQPLSKKEQRSSNHHLGESTHGGSGPLFSTNLCNFLYGLAAIVPSHPRSASHSPAVRGAALAQMMKVQNVLSARTPAAAFFDPRDGDRSKVLLYVRAIACVRCALQCVVGSWLAAGFGSKFAITEEGGQDFLQYCSKHILQAYNNKTAYTRVLGTPWECLMMSQGPTPMIVDLLLSVCSSDDNLLEVSKLGGQQALHNLSRYGDDNEVRQRATMLLTKLAVLSTMPGVPRG